MIRPSCLEDVPRLKALWNACFGDEAAYIDHYFKAYYHPDRALVLEEESEVVSMLLTFPFYLASDCGETIPVRYVYAFCTDPAQQGKGYGRSLLKAAEEAASHDGFSAVVMVPGEQSLFDFYATLGYAPLFTGQEKTFTPTGGGNYFPRPCTAQKYAQLRERWLFGVPHVSYDMETLEYQRSLCRNTGGGFYELGDSAAAVEVDGDTLYLKELLTADPAQAASALLTMLGASTAESRFPVLPGETGRPFGVVKWLTESPFCLHNGWLAFGFD